MEHKGFDQLRVEIADLQKIIEVDALYKHYKNGHIYTVTGLTVLEATDEVAVTYTDTEQDDVSFTRSATSWLQEVDGQSRFARIADI